MRFVFELGFKIIAIIISLAIMLGVVIDTFGELKEKSNKIVYDKNNICLICGALKENLEKNKINFFNHCEKDHNLWKYIDYIIYLRFENLQDLNAINSLVKELSEDKNTVWFPSSQSAEEN